MKKIFYIAAMLWAACSAVAIACTGITLKSGDGSYIVARTIEWGNSSLNSGYVVVPRGYVQDALTPDGLGGKQLVAKYGYVGLTVEQKEFVTEGINEAGLSAGLFYFPGYGEYETYDAGLRQATVTDLQLVAWMLGGFSTVDEVKEAIDGIHVVGIVPQASTAHWRITDASGRQVVLEITGGKPCFYENSLGVLTNSPGFEWQMTNLNNYVNLYPGNVNGQDRNGLSLRPFGAGAGMLGLPGDVTPPSRFVRAAFYQSTAPVLATARETVVQCFHILNNFDIPVGLEHAIGDVPAGLPSATQWTSATDITGRMIYYRSAWNMSVRCIDLKTINFGKVKFQYHPLEKTLEQPVEMIKVS